MFLYLLTYWERILWLFVNASYSPPLQIEWQLICNIIANPKPNWWQLISDQIRIHHSIPRTCRLHSWIVEIFSARPFVYQQWWWRNQSNIRLINTNYPQLVWFVLWLSLGFLANCFFFFCPHFCSGCLYCTYPPPTSNKSYMKSMPRSQCAFRSHCEEYLIYGHRNGRACSPIKTRLGGHPQPPSVPHHPPMQSTFRDLLLFLYLHRWSFESLTHIYSFAFSTFTSASLGLPKEITALFMKSHTK